LYYSNLADIAKNMASFYSNIINFLLFFYFIFNTAKSQSIACMAQL